jgi:hypothetical protein
VRETAHLLRCAQGVGNLIGQDEIAIMKNLILTIAHSRVNPRAVFADSIQLHEEADLAECLDRLRVALFLTGAAVESVKVTDDDRGSEWAASSDFLQRLVGSPFKQ